MKKKRRVDLCYVQSSQETGFNRMGSWTRASCSPFFFSPHELVLVCNCHHFWEETLSTRRWTKNKQILIQGRRKPSLLSYQLNTHTRKKKRRAKSQKLQREITIPVLLFVIKLFNCQGEVEAKKKLIDLVFRKHFFFGCVCACVCFHAGLGVAWLV